MKLEDSLSQKICLHFGVPQGIGAWPSSFHTLHDSHQHQHSKGTDPPSFVWRWQSTDLHVPLIFDSSTTLFHLQNCIDSVQSWMQWNKQKLSPSKTEFLFMGHEQQRNMYPLLLPVPLSGENIHPSQSARNLVVIFDHDFTFQFQVCQICSCRSEWPCLCYLWDLCLILKHVSLDSAKSVATAVVGSHLEYYNSL